VAKRLGINATDMECLSLLFHKKLATPTELAAHTGLSSGATTAMLDRLERAGMIERKPNPEDRRGTLVSVRQVRPEVIVSWFASAGQAQDKLLAGFADEALMVIADFLEKSAQLWEEERQKLE
ncbi:MAG: MarR family transcriptional regulator, partial [Anaerolineaceae bacterium]|nr:MarR family transcriptional regulator [Anaerolineaceae bacterium]